MAVESAPVPTAAAPPICDERERLIEALLTLASGEVGIDHRERVDIGTVARTTVARLKPESQRVILRVESDIRPGS